MDFPKPYLRIYETGGVAWEINVEPRSMYELLYDSAQRVPDGTAIIFYDRKISYKQLLERVNKAAAAFYELGLRKGDRIALMLPNCPDFVIAYYAIMRLGGIVVNTNPMYVEREIEYQLNDSGAGMIITLDDLYLRVKNVQDNTSLQTIILTGFKGKPAQMPGDALWLPDLYAADRPAPPEVEIDPVNDVALFQYTGGTTGVPKAAMLTHFNLYANTCQANQFNAGRGFNHRVLGVQPLFHVAGMTNCMNIPVVAGTTTMLLPKFVPTEVARAISDFQPTFFPVVPTMIVALLNHPELQNFKDFDKVGLYKSGAAPIPLEVFNRMQAKLEGSESVINEGYGLSETSPVVISYPNFDTRDKRGSVGIPYPGTHAAVVDIETGTRALPPGEVGELIVKGPQVMKGYWNRPEDTRRALRDGWLYTGDMAWMDEDGYFYIVDRKKDLIIAGGYNIYPREVEEVLFKHPQVQEAVVAGVPHEYRGETVKAYIVLKAGASATEDEMITYCKQNLAPYKVPKIVEFRSELPKTSVGKLLKRKLVDEEKQKLKARPE